MASELLDSKGQQNGADELSRVLHRYLKRYQARLATMFKYDFLGQDILDSVLPEPKAFESKRSWETAMANARAALRKMAQEVEHTSDSSDDGMGACDCNSCPER